MERIGPKPPPCGERRTVPGSSGQLASRESFEHGRQLSRVRRGLGALPFVELLRVSQPEAARERASVGAGARLDRVETGRAGVALRMVVTAGDREGRLEAPEVHLE